MDKRSKRTSSGCTVKCDENIQQTKPRRFHRVMLCQMVMACNLHKHRSTKTAQNANYTARCEWT